VGVAFADGRLLGSVVGGANGAVQNLVNQNTTGRPRSDRDQQGGTQSSVGSLNSATRAAVPATMSTVTAANGLVNFAVQGLLKPGP
jgi:hypothetical protein